MIKTYTRKTLSELSGVPYSRAEFYQNHGVFDTGKPGGKGFSVVYTDRHVVEAFIVRKLSKKGVGLKLEHCKKILKRLRTLELYTELFTPQGNVDASKIYHREDWHIYLIVYQNGEITFSIRKVGGWKSIDEFTLSMRGHEAAVIADITEIFQRLALV